LKSSPSEIEVSFTGDGFTVARVVVGPLDNNAFLVECTTTGVGLIVDAADKSGVVLSLAESAEVKGVLTTHGHSDHHRGADVVAKALDVPTMLHPADVAIADRSFDVDITEGQLPIGAVTAHVLHTPGHTPGSVCLALPGIVLTGDTLFPGGPGATRFPHSSFDAIIDSITSQLFTMQDYTVVLPGHGDATTIGNERGQLQKWIGRGW
jgi:glyoxylase-like metal-dependent hydrolase (beta-lactamase superfamily II)